MAKPILFSSLFGELTKNVQVRFDTASQMNKQVFDNVLYRKYLDWETPTVGLDFDALIGKYNLTIAAATIGNNAKEPIMDPTGLESVKNTVLRHAMTKPLSIQDYRKILQLLDSKHIADETKKKQLINLMWGEVRDVVNAVEGKLDLIFLSALSNEGKFTFDEKNNPEGGVRGNIDFKFDAGNTAKSKTKWTEGNIDTVDCMEDIQSVLEAAENKVQLGKILLAPSKVAYMCRSKKMKQMIFGSDKSASILQLSHINQYLEANDFPTIEKIKRQINVRKVDGTLEPITPWNADNIVFIPQGKLGTVPNAYADNELKPESDVAYSNYGRIRVSQWNVGETKGANYGEFTKAEVLALPTITEGNGIFTLKTDYTD